jgi:hypothetical protein
VRFWLVCPTVVLARRGKKIRAGWAECEALPFSLRVLVPRTNLPTNHHLYTINIVEIIFMAVRDLLEKYLRPLSVLLLLAEHMGLPFWCLKGHYQL